MDQPVVRIDVWIVGKTWRARRAWVSSMEAACEFGLDPAEIHTQLADLFERFGWADSETEGEDARVN